MKKWFLLSCLSTLLLAASGQTGARMNFEGGVAVPLRNGLKTGFSLSDRFILNPLNTTGQTCFVLDCASFAPDNDPLIKRYTLLALRGGYRFVSSGTRLFVDAEGGLGLLSQDQKVDSKWKSDIQAGFSFSGGVGYFLKENQRLALALRHSGHAGKQYLAWIGLCLSVTITRH